MKPVPPRSRTPESRAAPAVGGPVGRARRPRRLGRAGRVVLTVAAVVVGAPVVAVGGSWAWVRSTTAADRYDAAAVPGRPVAIVFGAAVLPDHTPSQFLAGRLDTARELFEEGRIAVIIVSGDNRSANYDEPTAMRDFLVREGVPAGRVVRDPAGYDTYDTCVRAHDVYGVDRAVLVTQDYHLPRALRICRSVGIDAVGTGTGVGRGTSAWTSGSRREVLADVKAVWQLATRPAPAVDGPRDAAVTRALSTAAHS